MKITVIYHKQFDGLTDQVEQEIDITTFTHIKIALDNGVEVIVKPIWKDEVAIRTPGCYMHVIPGDRSTIGIKGEPIP